MLGCQLRALQIDKLEGALEIVEKVDLSYRRKRIHIKLVWDKKLVLEDAFNETQMIDIRFYC